MVALMVWSNWLRARAGTARRGGEHERGSLTMEMVIIAGVVIGLAVVASVALVAAANGYLPALRQPPRPPRVR